MRRLQLWAVAFCITAFSVVGSILYVDRPLAKLAHAVFGHFEVVGSFSESPSLFDPLMILIAAIFILRRLARSSLSYPDVVLVLCEVSLLVTKLALAPLKLVFGRTWPLYVHPSFLADGVYGFNFFSHGLQYESFPSGHIASVSALAIVLWAAYPRFRPLYAVAIFGMAFALVLGNYHFLSDVIAGGFLGGAVATLSTTFLSLMAAERVRVRS